MADYVPIFAPGRDVTQTVGATAVAAGNLVAVSAPNTVIPTTGASTAWLGVATTDAAIGAKVGVTSGGVQELVAAAAVALTDVLVPAANGRVTPLAAGTNYAQVVGIPLTTAAAAGDKIRVKMAR